MADQTKKELRNKLMYQVFVRNYTEEGTFDGVRRDLDRIRDLGVDIVYLLPIHPIGEKCRKGSLGSPYAISDYRAVNPEYGTLEDFRALAEAIHEKGMKCIIDVVYNHTSPDSVLSAEHPEWFYRKEDGSFGNHVGDWSDIIDLDYTREGLAEYQIETLKMWANRLDSCKGELPIEPVVHCAWKWTSDLMDIVSATDDDALEFLIKRVCYYGIHCSVPFIIMRHWEEWVKDHKLSIDQHDLDLCELFMEVQLFSQKVFFGRMTEKYVVGSDQLIAEESAENIHTKTVQQLAQLPEEFTIASLQKTLGISNSYGRVLVSRWQKDGLINVDEKGKPRKYKKTEKGKTI